MTPLKELYEEFVNQKTKNASQDELDCLFQPQKYPVVWKLGDCSCNPEKTPACQASCLFNAIQIGKDGKLEIDENCVGCSACIDACQAKKLVASKDILPAMKAVFESNQMVYALVAPAFIGQFSAEVTPGMLRSAFRQIGFDGMVEVAIFADILTLKEALEFDRNIHTESDFQLTSCCCPMWIGMIRKIYHQLMPHVPGAVSPMIACGRTIKRLHPGAVTVFIGPCIVKKAEAREKDLQGAIDYVLTFQEMQDILDAFNVRPEEMRDRKRDHSSKGGRIYARTGGVSQAVQSTLEKLAPEKSVKIKTRQADGVPACKEMINSLLKGEGGANFFEGMGCVGGCVGGPKAVINREQGREKVEAYGERAQFDTPIENPYVLELLKRLGFHTVEELLADRELFTRSFEQ